MDSILKSNNKGGNGKQASGCHLRGDVCGEKKVKKKNLSPFDNN